MAKTKTKGPNKSKSIREYMRKNKGATVPQIVHALKLEGVTVTPGLVYGVKAYDAKKKTAKKVAKKAAKATATPAASTNGASGTTKADQIREVAGAMEKPVRPKDVRDVLATKGIDASTTFIGKVLASMGMKRKRRRKKSAAGSAAPGVASNGLNIDDLVAAKKLVAHVGSIEKVKEALSALARLG